MYVPLSVMLYPCASSHIFARFIRCNTSTDCLPSKSGSEYGALPLTPPPILLLLRVSARFADTHLLHTPEQCPHRVIMNSVIGSSRPHSLHFFVSIIKMFCKIFLANQSNVLPFKLAPLRVVFAHSIFSTWLPHSHFQLPHGFMFLVLQSSSMLSIRSSWVLSV